MKDLDQLCGGLLEVLDEKILPYLEDGEDAEARVYYYKLAGDYHRYLAEQPNTQQAALAEKAYSKALTEARLRLPPMHPTRLGLVLNFSVFHQEVMADVSKARELTLLAVETADAELTATKGGKHQAMELLDVLKGNLERWAGE